MSAGPTAARPPSPRRPYRLGVRADAMDRTRAEILDATISIGIRDPGAVTLASVAKAAGVSTRTVIRHFGSRDGLVAAAIRNTERRVAEERFAVPTGEVDAIVANLVGHYEEWGDHDMALLAQEGSGEEVDRILERGRRLHRRWTHEKLGPLVDGLDRAARRRRLAQLVAITDVYTWKLLRKDQGLSRSETETAIAEMISAVTGFGE